MLIKALHNFTDKVIVARREKLLSSNNNLTDVKRDDDNVGGRQKMALLDLLLQSTIDGEYLTNSDIREEIDTFMFEGIAQQPPALNLSHELQVIFIV